MKKIAAIIAAVLVAGAMSALPQSASAVEINFASYQASMTDQVSPTISGLTFSNSQQHIFPGSLGPNNFGDNFLASFMSANSNPTFLTITAANGGQFSLHSFLASCNMYCQRNTTMEVIGYFANGERKTQAETQFERFQVSYIDKYLGWSGLEKVEIRTPQGTSMAYLFFKKFNADVSPASVPEPGTYSLLLAGLAMMAWTFRRKASTSSTAARHFKDSTLAL